MLTRKWCACLTLSFVLPALAIMVVAAKPPDLPVDVRAICVPEAEEEDQTAPESAGTEESCPCLDGCCAEFCQALCKYLQTLAGDQAEESEAAEEIPVMPTVVATPVENLDVMPAEVTQPDHSSAGANSQRLAEVRRLYHIAERCRRSGDLDMAANCYEEVTRICPESSYARKSRVWLVKVKLARTPEEPASAEQEDNNIGDLDHLEDLLKRAEQLRRQSQEPPACPCPFRRDAGQDDTQTNQLPENSVRMIYRRGQRCLRDGSIGLAHRCFQEVVHQASPESAWGRKAVKKIKEIEERIAREAAEAAGAEEQSHPDKPMSEAEVRKLLDGSEPLEIYLDEVLQNELMIEEESASPSTSSPSNWKKALGTLLGGTCIEVDVSADGWRSQGTLSLGSFSFKLTRDKQGAVQAIILPLEMKP